MPVAVQYRHPHHSQGAACARLAPGGGKPAESSRHAADDLLAADRRAEFLAMISHELQNLLGSILMGVEFVRDTESSLPRSDWLWSGLETSTRQVQNLLA